MASCLIQENKDGAHESNRFGHIDTPVHCPLAVLIRSSGPTSNSNRIFCLFFHSGTCCNIPPPRLPTSTSLSRQMLKAQPHPLPPPECNHTTLSLASCERPKPPLKFAECRARNFVWVDFCRQIYTCSSRGNLGGHFSVVFWSIFVRCVGRFLVIFWSIFGRQVDFCSFFGRFLVVFWSFFGRFLIVFWSFFGRFLVVFWPSIFCHLPVTLGQMFDSKSCGEARLLGPVVRSCHFAGSFPCRCSLLNLSLCFRFCCCRFQGVCCHPFQFHS